VSSNTAIVELLRKHEAKGQQALNVPAFSGANLCNLPTTVQPLICQFGKIALFISSLKQSLAKIKKNVKAFNDHVL
jgi:hypothetical protein